MSRTAAEIGTTEQGPRALPPLGTPGTTVNRPATDTVLPNGLRLLAVRAPAVPMVELRLAIPFAGDDPLHCACSEVLAETILTGTARRDRVGVDTELALVGGELSTVVDPQRLSISGGALASGLGELLDVLADSLTGAAYSDAEVDRERERLVERIAMARAQPDLIARESLQRHRYGDHPYAREVPRAEDVARVTAEDVRSLHAAAVLPRGAVMVLVGDIEPDAAVAAVSAALSGWSSEHAAGELAALPEIRGGDIALVPRENAVQSQIRLSAQAVDRSDPVYPALQLANYAFGGFFSSRLVENIREDKGYTYHARSSIEFAAGAATVLVSTDAATEVTAATLSEVRAELAGMVERPPSDTEVETVRQYAIGSLAIGTSSQSGLAAQLMALAEVGLGMDWLRTHESRLRAVTTADVAEAARRFYAPQAYTGIVVGDAEVLAEPLAGLGGVATR